MKVEWSPLALDWVSEIARYSANDNPDAGERWVNELSCAERIVTCNVTGYTPAHDPEFQIQLDIILCYKIDRTMLILMKSIAHFLVGRILLAGYTKK